MAVVVIDTIKPKNQGTFPVVEAADVKVTNDKRLDTALNEKANASTVEALSTAVAGKASQSDVTALQTAVAGKASQSDLNALSSTVSNKADKSALAETNAAVAGKQAALTEEQLAACNSGITSALVTQIGTNTTAIAGKADAADLTALSSEVSDKADAADVATATADLQSQIDLIVTPVTQDAEVQNARVDTEGTTHASLKERCDSDYNTLYTMTNGEITTISTHYDTTWSGQATNIYRSNRVEIPENAQIDQIKYYVNAVPPEGAFNCFYILSSENVILDKFTFAPTETGWQILTINKRYNQKAYIAVARGGIGLSYSTTSKTTYYSNGLFESTQTSADIGDTLTFTQNVAERYYEFGIEVRYSIAGISSQIAALESELESTQADIESTQTEVDTLDAQINYGVTNTQKCYWDENGSGIGGNIYKSNKVSIPANTTVSQIKFKSTTGQTSAIVFIINSSGKILDKYEVTQTLGWNTINVNKDYDETAYIAVSGGAIINSYSNTEKTTYYSNGLFEAANSDRTKAVGDTLTFTQNVPERYYELAVEIICHNPSIVESIENLAEQISEIIVPTIEFKLTDNIMPKIAKTGETGYTLLGHWYRYSDDFPECCNSGGASIMFKVKNATSISVDIEQIVHPSHPEWTMAVQPYIAISIDGGSFTRTQIGTSAISVSVPTTDEHFVWIVIDGMCLNSGSANRKSGWSGVYIKEITSNGDMYKVEVKSKQILFVGDSIVEGINTLGTTSTSEANSQINEFTFKTARKLNSFPLIQGYGGTTTATGIEYEKYSVVDQTKDTFFDKNTPDIILIEYGFNDRSAGYTSQQFKDYYNELIDLLEGHYPGVPVLCLVPFAQSFATEIEEIASARSYCYLIDTSDYNVTYSDGTHPSAAGAEEIARRLSADIQEIFSNYYFI